MRGVHAMITLHDFVAMKVGDRIFDVDGIAYVVEDISRQGTLDRNKTIVFPVSNCIAGITMQANSGGFQQSIFWDKFKDCIVDENGDPSDLFTSDGASWSSPTSVPADRLWSTPPSSKS